MRSSLLFSMFIILAIIGAVLPGSIAHAETGAIIPLEYYQAGNVKPGYEVTVSLHAVGMTAMPVPVSHAFGDSGLEFQGHKFGIVGDDGGGATTHVYYLIDGVRHEIDTFHYGKHEYDATVKITAYCPGEQAPGSPGKPSNNNLFWVHVLFQGDHGTYEKWILVQLGGNSNTAVPLNLYYERTPGLQSWASITETKHFADCGNIIGNPPHPGDDTRHDNDDNGFNLPWKWLGLAIVVLLIIILIKF